jgi:hypothetical protein
MTLYDAEHSSGLDNGQAFPSLGSRDKPQVNAAFFPHAAIFRAFLIEHLL